MNLASIALAAREHPVLLVDFWADWCGPCKKLAPVLDQLAMEIPELTVIKVDIDVEHDVARHFGIMSVPTLMLYVGGEMVGKRTGFVPLRELRDWIESNVQ